MLVKVRLRDACPPGSGEWSVPVRLEDDCCAGPCGCNTAPCDPCEPVTPDGLVVVELRRRMKTGYDEPGNPVFEWDTLARGGAVVFEVRSEFDPVAGTTIATGDIKIANPGIGDIKETCVVVQDGDPPVHWMVTGSQVSPLSIDLKVRRIDGDYVS